MAKVVPEYLKQYIAVALGTTGKVEIQTKNSTYEVSIESGPTFILKKTSENEGRISPEENKKDISWNVYPIGEHLYFQLGDVDTGFSTSHIIRVNDLVVDD